MEYIIWNFFYVYKIENISAENFSFKIANFFRFLIAERINYHLIA